MDKERERRFVAHFGLMREKLTLEDFLLLCMDMGFDERSVVTEQKEFYLEWRNPLDITFYSLKKTDKGWVYAERRGKKIKRYPITC